MTSRRMDIETQPLDSRGASSSSPSATIRFNRSQIHILPAYPPPRTTIAAVLMLILGIFFLIYGGIIFFSSEGLNNDKGMTLFILGGIMFLPGSYASFILFGAWMRWRGFTYDLIPSYDE